MIAHAKATPAPVLPLVIAVIEPALGAGAMTLLRSTSCSPTPLATTRLAIQLATMAAAAHREDLAAAAAAKLDPVVVHAPRRAEILAPLSELRDGPPVHAPAGHESREL